VAIISKPSRVDRAFERVEAALTRLEQAAKARPAATGGGDNADAEALRVENQRLQAVNDEVKGRLDGAIERLEQVLGAQNNG